MPRIKFYLTTLDVRPRIGGKPYDNMTAVGEVELTVDRRGRPRVAPVVLEGVIPEGERGLAELLGARPWGRKDVTLLCYDHQGADGGGRVARIVRLRRCRFTGYRLAPITLEGDALRERVTLRPAGVSIHTPLAEGG